MNATNIIIIIILVVILIPAVKTSITHMKGEGDCCGGPKEKPKKKKIEGKPIKKEILNIEGMQCNNCRVRLENKLNEIDDIVAKVNLAKKTAEISYYKDVEKTTIVEVVERLDFKVK